MEGIVMMMMVTDRYMILLCPVICSRSACISNAGITAFGTWYYAVAIPGITITELCYSITCSEVMIVRYYVVPHTDLHCYLFCPLIVVVLFSALSWEHSWEHWRVWDMCVCVFLAMQPSQALIFLWNCCYLPCSAITTFIVTYLERWWPCCILTVWPITHCNDIALFGQLTSKQLLLGYYRLAWLAISEEAAMCQDSSGLPGCLYLWLDLQTTLFGLSSWNTWWVMIPVLIPVFCCSVFPMQLVDWPTEVIQYTTLLFPWRKYITCIMP